MSYPMRAGGGLEYYPYRLGRSRLTFRGPRRQVEGRHIAFLGGTETFGLFVGDPFPAQVERLLGLPCVNLGALNAGPDLYLNDAPVLAQAARADVAVIQVMGAQTLCNRYYSVHPRRNDRFLRASGALQELFPELDFTEFSFTGHLLRALQATAPDRFARVVTELQAAWLARMKQLIALMRGQVVLLWFGRAAPGDVAVDPAAADPLFITTPMLESLRPRVADLMLCPASDRILGRGTRGLIFAPQEAAAAQAVMGPLAHEEAAEGLAAVLPGLLP